MSARFLLLFACVCVCLPSWMSALLEISLVLFLLVRFSPWRALLIDVSFVAAKSSVYLLVLASSLIHFLAFLITVALDFVAFLLMVVVAVVFGYVSAREGFEILANLQFHSA